MRSNRRWIALVVAAVLSGSMPIADAAARIVTFGNVATTAPNVAGVYPYTSGTSRLFDVAGDWASGTLTNTAVNGAGDLQLSPAGAGFSPSGTWESPTIDAGGTGSAAVYGLVNAAFTTPTGAANIALGKSSSQSSVGFQGTPGFGNDGNTSGIYGYAAGSVFHTGFEQGWWEVDLGASTGIDTVRLWNRTDCCSNRSSNLWVMVSPNPFPVAASSAALPVAFASAKVQAGVTSVQLAGQVASPSIVTLPPGTTGRYVRVWQPIVEWLHLAEIEVFATAPTAKIQVAYADAVGGPWSFVGPDGTAATSYAVGLRPFPYAFDGHRYSRIKVSLTGGSATPVVQSIQTNQGLVRASRSPGGTHAVAASTGSTSWVARILPVGSALSSTPTKLTLDPAVPWTTGNLSVGFDNPAVTCCSAPFVSVVGGVASVTGAAPVVAWPVGSSSAISVVGVRGDGVAASGKVIVRFAPSTTTVVELPLTIAFP